MLKPNKKTIVIIILAIFTQLLCIYVTCYFFAARERGVTCNSLSSVFFADPTIRRWTYKAGGVWYFRLGTNSTMNEPFIDYYWTSSDEPPEILQLDLTAHMNSTAYEITEKSFEEAAAWSNGISRIGLRILEDHQSGKKNKILITHARKS
jgi:hypothetical protein